MQCVHTSIQNIETYQSPCLGFIITKHKITGYVLGRGGSFSGEGDKLKNCVEMLEPVQDFLEI